MTQPYWDRPREQWAPPPTPVVGLGKAAVIMAYVTAAVGLVVAAGNWHAYSLAQDYVAGHASAADVDDADALDLKLVFLSAACLIATAVLVITWTYKARVNAERLCTAQHRRSRGWTIGGWFCPVVDLWFPAMIVEDIYRTSRPGTRHDQVNINELPRVPLIRYWWAPFILSDIVNFLTANDDNTLDGLHLQVVGSAFSAVLYLVAAVPLGMIIRQVSAWQSEPRTAGLQ